MAGPTSFAPVIETAMSIVEKSGGQYHVLLIIADGQVNCIYPYLVCLTKFIVILNWFCVKILQSRRNLISLINMEHENIKKIKKKLGMAKGVLLQLLS